MFLCANLGARVLPYRGHWTMRFSKAMLGKGKDDTSSSLYNINKIRRQDRCARNERKATYQGINDPLCTLESLDFEEQHSESALAS
jgi:hypothetical protein